MKQKQACILVIAMVLTTAVVPSWAHHAGVWFDSTKWVAVDGVITTVEWRNPHMWVYLEAKDDNGRVVKCAFEGPSSQAAGASGVSARVLKVGNRVTIEGHPNKDGSCGGDFEAVTVDGKQYYPRGKIIRK